MSKLTLEEFNKLPEKEKNIRYKDLNDHDKLMIRLTIIPKPSSKEERRKLTKKQKKEAEEFSKAIEDGKISEWFHKNN